jgi:phosphopantetheinyl transferase
MYHSSTKMISFNQRGMITECEQKEGKGSLMDVMGQQLGVFLHLTMEQNTISFPTKVERMDFFSDYRDQAGHFLHTLLITQLDEKNIIGNMIFTRQGRPWMITRGFTCQRFINDRPVWFVLLKPEFNRLAHELAPGVFYYTSALRSGIVSFLYYRYLNYEDKAERDALRMIPKQYEHLISRIAAKDAVRIVAARRDGLDEMIYPIEIFIDHDEAGAPHLRTRDKYAGYLDGINVSIAHKGLKSLASASLDGVIGVDLDTIEDRVESFISLSFTDSEQTLMAQTPWSKAEAVTRFWTAKEAAAKKTGQGLKGNPKNYEVIKADGETLTVAGKYLPAPQDVQTHQVDDTTITAWTL